MNSKNGKAGKGLVPCRRRSAGLSLVEILVALAITAMLLTATAMAFDAALRSYQANHDMAMTSIAVRNSLYQMCAAIRSAWNDDINSIVVSTDGSQCSLVDANGQNLIYRYDANMNQLQVNVNYGADWYVFIDNVEPIITGDKIITAVAPFGTGFPPGTLGRIDIRFKVRSGGESRTVSASAVPRNVVYH